MNTKNNLQNALKNAFENYEVPLNEAQWTRLEGAIAKKKRRWFFPFFIILLTLSFTAGSMYFIQIKSKPAVSQARTEHHKTLLVSSPNSKPQVIAEPHSSNTNSNSFPTFTTASKPFNPKQPLPLHIETSPTPIIVPSIISNSDTTIASTKTAPVLPIEPSKDSIPLPLITSIATPDSKTSIDSSIASYQTKKASVPKTDPPLVISAKYIFSLAAGYSNMNVKVVGIENQGAMHKDSRSLFEQSNKNISTDFFNFGFDWNILPKYRLGLSTGIQYLRVASTVNINYKLTEIPFWNSNRTQIDGYVTKSPQDAINLNTNTTNYTTYLIIPIKFNYTIPVNNKNEFLFNGGLNLTTLAAAKGKNIDISNTPQVQSIDRSMFRQLNTGWSGGIQYASKLNKHWWLGIDNSWQTNPMKFKVGEGSIKNKLQGFSVNLLLKYKI